LRAVAVTEGADATGFATAATTGFGARRLTFASTATTFATRRPFPSGPFPATAASTGRVAGFVAGAALTTARFAFGSFTFATAGFRATSRAKCGAASAGIVTTPSNPTPTHARNRLLTIRPPRVCAKTPLYRYANYDQVNPDRRDEQARWYPEKVARAEGPGSC
jgi:hypothetical protein